MCNVLRINVVCFVHRSAHTTREECWSEDNRLCPEPVGRIACMLDECFDLDLTGGAGTI
jgi:hypothetical protein